MPVMMLTQDFEPDDIPVVKLQQSYDDDTSVALSRQTGTLW
jgi:hypothetical protein